MFRNEAQGRKRNICGERVGELRKALPGNVSQRRFAEILCLHGMDADKNTVARIERGERHVADWELKVIREIFRVSYEELLE